MSHAIRPAPNGKLTESKSRATRDIFPPYFPTPYFPYFQTVGMSVTISMGGHFFSEYADGLDWGKNMGLSGTDFEAFILLHELGHELGVYGATNNDGFNQASEDVNN